MSRKTLHFTFLLLCLMITSPATVYSYEDRTCATCPIVYTRKPPEPTPTPTPTDPFKKVMVEVIIPEGIELFIDPLYGCEYFITRYEGKITSMTPRLKGKCG